MDRPLAAAAADARERVIVFLAFFTSEACRDAFRAYVADEAWAALLCRLWFDEIYVPGTHYLDGLKGDRRADRVRAFEAAFTPEERVLLERFHGCFELRLELLTNRVHGRAFIPDNDSWRSLLRDARAVLAALEPNPERLQEVLAAIVRRMAAGEAPGASLWPGAPRRRLPPEAQAPPEG